MAPRRSSRRPSGAVYLPEVRSDSGASLGGAMKVFAGRKACPASVAGKGCCAGAEAMPKVRVRAPTAIIAETVIFMLMFLAVGEGLHLRRPA